MARRPVSVVLAYSEDQTVSKQGYKVRPPSMKSI
jgi:hypothetical protein